MFAHSDSNKDEAKTASKENEQPSELPKNPSYEKPPSKGIKEKLLKLKAFSFNTKSLNHQYILYTLMSVALLQYIYYLLYTSSFLDLIKASILPVDKSYLLYTATATVVVTLVLSYRLPVDPEYHLKQEFKEQCPSALERVHRLLREEKFKEAYDYLQPLYSKIRRYHLISYEDECKNIKEIIDLNLKFMILLDELESVITSHNFVEITKVLNKINYFLGLYSVYLGRSLVQKYYSLYEKMYHY